MIFLGMVPGVYIILAILYHYFYTIIWFILSIYFYYLCSGENLEEVSGALDELDSVIEALSVDVIKAKV